MQDSMRPEFAVSLKHLAACHGRINPDDNGNPDAVKETRLVHIMSDPHKVLYSIGTSLII